MLFDLIFEDREELFSIEKEELCSVLEWKGFDLLLEDKRIIDNSENVDEILKVLHSYCKADQNKKENKQGKIKR